MIKVNYEVMAEVYVFIATITGFIVAPLIFAFCVYKVAYFFKKPTVYEFFNEIDNISTDKDKKTRRIDLKEAGYSIILLFYALIPFLWLAILFHLEMFLHFSLLSGVVVIFLLHILLHRK